MFWKRIWVGGIRFFSTKPCSVCQSVMQTRQWDLGVHEPSPKVSLYNMMTEDAISVAISWMKSSPCVLDPVPDKLFGVGASSLTKKHVTTLFCSLDVRLMFLKSSHTAIVCIIQLCISDSYLHHTLWCAVGGSGRTLASPPRAVSCRPPEAVVWKC